ncbi:MAG: hypothetical protein V9G23_12875 [Giesbergeria sp.]
MTAGSAGACAAGRSGCPGALAQVQEAVFAGVWRVLDALGRWHAAGPHRSREPFPRCSSARRGKMHLSGFQPDPTPPAGVMNAPTLLQELQDQRQQWRPGLARAPGQPVAAAV